MAEFLSPGVFIEEVPSAAQVIAGVSTSNMGIVGFTPKGPTDEAVLVTSTEQFYRKFGPLSPNSFTGHSVLAFYANGGRRCFVVRVVPANAAAADLDVQSKVYDHQLDTGDGTTVAFSETALTTSLNLPVVAKNVNSSSLLSIRWRQTGSAVAAQRVKARNGTTNVSLVAAQAVYEFRIDPAGAIASPLAEGDLKQYVVVPGTVILSFDPDGGGARTITLNDPTIGTVSVTNGDGATTDSATEIVFDYATGVGSIRFGNEDVNDIPDVGVVVASLTLDYTASTGTYFIAEDGAGVLVSVTPFALSAPGTINYNTGAWSFTATTAPHDKAPILCTYNWAPWNIDPISKGQWSNSVKVQVRGNVDAFDSATQSYSLHDVLVLELNTSTNEYDVQESYEALDMTDSTSSSYFPDVINELSDLVSVDSPGGDAYPGMLDGQRCALILGGGDEGATANNGVFGGVELLSAYLINQGREIGPRSVNIAATGAGTAATGTITSIAQASFVDGEKFVLADGVNAAVTFWIDQTGTFTPVGGYNATNVRVNISGDTTAITTATTIMAAINGAAISIWADNGGGTLAVVSLTNVQQLAAGNITITETVLNAGFLVTGMSGGVDPTALLVQDDGAGGLTGDIDPAYVTIVTVGGLTLQPNTVDYESGYANFKFSADLKGGTVVTSTVYTDSEETSREEQFGDADKAWTDSLAATHYIVGDDGTFTTVNYSRSQFTNPTLQATKRGVYAFDAIDEILQVIIPDFAGDTVVTGDLLDYAASRASLPSGGDRFIILTTPLGCDPQEAVSWFRFDLGRFSKWAALYWPWVKIADPLIDGRTLTMPALGHIAGVYARTDSNRNVGKAPGGTVDGALNFLTGLEYEPSQGERDYVYPYKINPLISSPQTGLAVWGVRTIAQESEWRHINARRLFMFMEKSVYNATGWIVFENNGPALWSRIKGQLDSFMTGLFNQGMFYGTKPSDAYFVICDSSNNTTESIDAGQVIIDVGAAPNRPAEFVRFRFQQQTIG